MSGLHREAPQWSDETNPSRAQCLVIVAAASSWQCMDSRVEMQSIWGNGQRRHCSNFVALNEPYSHEMEPSWFCDPTTIAAPISAIDCLCLLRGAQQIILTDGSRYAAPSWNWTSCPHPRGGYTMTAAPRLTPRRAAPTIADGSNVDHKAAIHISAAALTMQHRIGIGRRTDSIEDFVSSTP